MAAANLDLTIEQGATFAIEVQLKDKDGVPVDLTGWTAAAQMRRKPQDATAIQFTIAFDGDRTTGKLNMSLTNVQTAALKVDPSSGATKKLTQYAYDLELTRPSDGAVIRALEGIANVSPEVTR